MYNYNKLELEKGNCIYVDDREVNLEAAGKVGMRPVLFNIITFIGFPK